MDLDGDGVVDREEFSAALQWLNQRHRLNLTDQYITRAFREADADYSQVPAGGQGAGWWGRGRRGRTI
jgi:hypothetical protein